MSVTAHRQRINVSIRLSMDNRGFEGQTNPQRGRSALLTAMPWPREQYNIDRPASKTVG